MILTFLRIAFLRLRNNPLELLLVFVMPVLFFSIFAMIFSQGIAAGTEKPVRLGLLLPEDNEDSRALREQLLQKTSLICTDLRLPTTPEQQQRVILDAQNSSHYDLLLQLPPDFSRLDESRFQLRLITDGQNAMATAMVKAILEEYYAVQRVQVVVEKLQDSARTAAKVAAERAAAQRAAAEQSAKAAKAEAAAAETGRQLPAVDESERGGSFSVTRRLRKRSLPALATQHLLIRWYQTVLLIVRRTCWPRLRTPFRRGLRLGQKCRKN